MIPLNEKIWKQIKMYDQFIALFVFRIMLSSLKMQTGAKQLV